MANSKSKYMLVIYFTDGKTGRFPSNDKKGKKPEKGLAALQKLVVKYADKYTTALIYDRETDTLLEKYVFNQKIDLHGTVAAQ